MLPGLSKEIAKDIMGPFYKPVRDYLVGPLLSTIYALIDPSHNLYWLYIVTALFATFLIYLFQTRKNHNFSWEGFREFCLPKRVFAHKSAILDYKFYFFNAVVYKLVYGGTVLGSSEFLSGYFHSGIQRIFGPSPTWQPTMSSRITYTVLVIMLIDFGVFLGHFLEHKIPFFWEFHKVHHSAEVLTPFTNYRNHPVDKFLEMLLVSIFTGALVGAFTYLYPSGVAEYKVINISVLFFIYYLLANLRHSHVWLSYGWRLDHIFSSPCLHQIHHSSEKRHFDKNFALVFSIWDYLAGTLYVPKGKEEFKWGISNQEHLAYNSIWNLYYLPIKKALALFEPRRGSQAPDSITQQR